MLNQSFDQLGDAFLRNRAMAQQKEEHQADNALRERQISVEQGRADAENKHYQNMETAGAANETSKAKQAAVAEKGKLLQAVMLMNRTGQLGEDALANINEWLSTDEDFSFTGMQLQKPATPSTTGKDAAAVNMIKQVQAFREQAQQTEDPEQAAQFDAWADILEDVVKKSGSFAPAQGYETTTEKAATDTKGRPTGEAVKTTTRKVPIPLPGAAGTASRAAGQPAAAAAVAVAPLDPKLRKSGQRYKSPTNPNLTAVWTGAGWDTNAPAVAVPGFGAAKP